MKTLFSHEAKVNIYLCIKNIKCLMHNVLQHCPENKKQKVCHSFEKKLVSIVNKITNWYAVYKTSIPDSLLMIFEHENKMSILKQNLDTNNIIQSLNYNINIEIYNYMNKIYNS